MTPQARQAVDLALAPGLDPALASTLLPRVGHELDAGRRTLAGLAASLVGVGAGFLLGLAPALLALGDVGAAEAVVAGVLLLLGLALAAGAAVVGLAAWRDGRRVLRAFRACCAVVEHGSRPSSLIAHLVDARAAIRTAMAVLGLLGGLLGLTLVGLALVGDTAGDLVVFSVVLGLAMALGLGLPGLAVIGGQVRAAAARGRAVAGSASDWR